MKNIRLYKQIAAAAIGSIAFLFVIGLAGNAEYAEQVIYSMQQETYDTIAAKLGNGCTQQEIAEEYMANKEHYDSLVIF